MTRLKLRLHQGGAKGRLEAGAIAKVRLVAELDGSVAREWWQEEKPVDIEGESHQDGPWTLFALPKGGLFRIEINRPRGADLTREVEIAEGETHPEDIGWDPSPHEFLGWQKFAGVSKSPAKGRLRSLDPALLRSPGKKKGLGIERGSTGEEFLEGKVFSLGKSADDEVVTRGARHPDPVSAATPLDPSPAAIGRTPQCLAAAVPANGEAWRVVSPKGQGWARHAAIPDWPEPTVEGDYAYWLPEMPDSSAGRRLVEQLHESSPGPSTDLDRFPRWMSVAVDGHIDLVSVPWAWWGARREKDERIDFVYNRSRPSAAHGSSPGGSMTISLRDQRWFSLLEFLAAGRLDRAGKIFDQVLSREQPDELFEIPEAALMGKVKGPLVATAGAILLVAREKNAEPQTWDRWLDNLYRWFPGIPDGAMLLGCRRVAQARDLDSLNAAFAYLMTGIERGLPFFTATLHMLMKTLARLSSDLEAAETARLHVAPVAASVDPSQPFTVLRL